MAVRAEVTEIAQDFEGDAFAPVLGAAWKETARRAQLAASGLAFSFVTYLKHGDSAA
jgi:dihydrofolate reductase